MTFLRKLIYFTCLTAALIFPVSIDVPVHAEENQKEPTVLEGYQEETPDTKKEENTEIETSDREISSTAADSLGFFDFFRMIAGFIFVIALLYIILRFINKKSKAYQKGSTINNLGGTSLGNNKSIQLVKIGSKIFIVGVGENVQLLGEVTNESDMQEILDDYNSDVELMLKPTDLLSKLYKNRKGEKDSQQQSTFSEQLKKQLAEMKKNREQLQKEVKKKVNSKDE